MSSKILPHYTIEEWKRWEDSWELIDGIPFAKVPAPLPKHQRICGNICMAIDSKLKKQKLYSVYPAIDWIISDDIIVVPDVLVIPGAIEERLNFAPELIAEVLSPETEILDRNSKYHLYLHQKVKYYLIIDPAKEAVEIYEYINDEYQLQQHSNTFQFTFPQNCSAEINFTSIWE